MNRARSRFFGLACCAALMTATPLRAEPPAGSPACIYANKTYSDGAFICVQKSLMLSCVADGARARWNVVADRDFSDRCVAPTTPGVAAGPRRHRPHASRPRVAPAAAADAKCFHFNGKQYCE